MKKITISARLVFNLLFIILLFGIALIFFVRNFVYHQMIRQFESMNLFVVKDLAEDCIDPILTDNLYFVKAKKLTGTLNNTKMDFKYIYILDKRNVPLVHTFDEGFPSDLLTANQLVPHQTYRMQLLNVNNETIREIAVPILNGKLGSMHAGISEARIRHTVNMLVIKMILIMAVILLIGMQVTYYLARRSLLPLNEINRALKEVGAGNLKYRIQAREESEINLLIATFNEMAERLEKAKNELQAAQDQVMQSSKMATMGQFAAGIAHEINNPLGAIVNYVRKVLAHRAIEGQNKEYLELTLKGLSKIENIIRQILGYSSRRNSEPRTVSINQLIGDAITLMNHKLLEKNIQVDVVLNEQLPDVMVDPSQIQQIFINIISNAIDAMSPGGKLTIKTSMAAQEQQITFTDNGKGIREQDLKKIFDPFFTTKEVGKGVGLGLFISYTIIRLYRGTIQISSKEGEGTSVQITLPVIGDGNDD